MTKQKASDVRKSLGVDLGLPHDKVEEIVAAGIYSGKVEDDAKAQPIVSMDDFAAAVADVKKSLGAATEQVAEVKKAVDPFDDQLEQLVAKFDAQVEQDEKRYQNVAKGLAAIGDLLSKVVAGLVKVDEHIAAVQTETSAAVGEVQKSLGARLPPRANTTTSAMQADGKTEVEKRTAVMKSINAELATAPTKQRAQALSMASAQLSTGVPADAVATALGITL